MTKILSKTSKMVKNTPKTIEMIKIPLKPKIIEMTKIPLKKTYYVATKEII